MQLWPLEGSGTTVWWERALSTKAHSPLKDAQTPHPRIWVEFFLGTARPSEGGWMSRVDTAALDAFREGRPERVR